MTLRIDVNHLELRYGDVTALYDLTFSLAGGKIYGLLGRNGSGKTSLLSVLAAFRKPSHGTVQIEGQPVFENPIITRQVCFVGEGGGLSDKSEPVKEIFDIARHLRPSWDARYAETLAAKFDIPLNKKLSDLSLGQQSAVGIVLGMASRAPVTIFDESYLGMDAPSRQMFQDELLSDFMANPRTFILSTHLVEEMSTLFEEVLIINRGRLLMHSDTEALRAQGMSVTGPAEAVDKFVAGRTVLNEKQLGRTKSVMVYGRVADAERRRAQETGLDIGPVALQDLFIHLTQPSGEAA